VKRLLIALVVLSAAAPALAQPDDWSYRRHHDGVRLRVLRDYHLAAGASANEPVVVIGGAATIDGRAEDVLVIAGTLRIGPRAVIEGDVVSIGGEAFIDPAARISGRIDETAIAWPVVELARLANGWWAVIALGATLLRLGVGLVFCLLLTLVAPRWIDDIGRRAESSAGAAALLGVTGQVLFVPGLVVLIVALSISVIGIPLLAGVPFLIGAAGIMWAAGFTAVSALVGARLRGRTAGAYQSQTLDVIVGYLAIACVTIIGHLIALGSPSLVPLAWTIGGAGLLIEYLAWTVGLGAAMAVAFNGRQRATPPPSLPLSSPLPTGM